MLSKWLVILRHLPALSKSELAISSTPAPILGRPMKVVAAPARRNISREKFSFSKIFKVHYSFSTFLVPLYNKVDPELIMFETLILSPRECREDPGTSMRIKSCTKIGEISLKAACAQSQTPKNIKFTQCTSLTSLTALPRLGHE